METREEQQWKREALRPVEDVDELIQSIADLPIGGQIQVLRALVRRVIPAMRHEERADFFCDLEDNFF